MHISGPFAVEAVPPVPWKNNGGLTRTLVVEPDGAGLEDFFWRISLAEILASGSFSAYPGVDRGILLWRGQGMVLRSPSWPEHRLLPDQEPFRFRGEDEVTCELLGTSTADLNLMVRRGCATGEVLRESAETKIAAPCDSLFVLCATGLIHVLPGNGEKLVLEPECFLKIQAPDAEIKIIPSAPRASYVYATVRRLP
jgi:uncharacterized protein